MTPGGHPPGVYRWPPGCSSVAAVRRACRSNDRCQATGSLGTLVFELGVIRGGEVPVRLRPFALFGAGLLIGVTVGVAQAAIPSATGVYTACYDAKGGTLH